VRVTSSEIAIARSETMDKNIKYGLLRWLDSEAGMRNIDTEGMEKTVDWLRIVPFVMLHLGCLGVFRVGWSPVALWVAFALYLIRMFAITGFYHRYFSLKAFDTGRVWQFVFAVVGNASAQRGPLWWAGHHRHHHRFADTPSHTCC
jgi:stearoyl-CoA desaturase (delta-9 desaturase)